MGRPWHECTQEELDYLERLAEKHESEECKFIQDLHHGFLPRIQEYRRSPEWRRVPEWDCPVKVSGEFDAK